MLEEFKKFAMRGNVVDLAVGVIIGAAFGAIVNSLVNDLIMPMIGAITGGLDFSNYFLPLSSKVRATALVDARLDIHIVMDNYATHKTPKIKAWLARRSHYHVHFTPTSASWINQIERWFAELTRKRLRRGVHTSVRQLEADIHSFIDRHNQNPRPFNGPNLPTKSWLQLNASATKRSRHYAPNFRFT